MNAMKDKVTKPEDKYTIFNPTTQHSTTLYYSPDEKLGKKWVMSNACEHQISNTVGQGVPLFDLYGATFSTCDNFNRSLHDRTWPLRKGGFNKSGYRGKEHDFIFSCILHNTFEYFFDVRDVASSTIDFRNNCEVLARELFLHAQRHF